MGKIKNSVVTVASASATAAFTALQNKSLRTAAIEHAGARLLEVYDRGGSVGRIAGAAINVLTHPGLDRSLDYALRAAQAGGLFGLASPAITKPKAEVGVAVQADTSTDAGRFSEQVPGLLNAGQPEEALRCARLACQLESDNPIHQTRRGVAEKRLGDVGAAMEAFAFATQASELHTGKKWGPAHYNMSAVHASRGDVDQALAELEVAQANIPEGKQPSFFSGLVGEAGDPKRDTDFDPIRENAAFQAFMARAQAAV